MGESGVGLLVYTLTHMVRSRLVRPTNDPEVDDLIESTRATLGRLVGHALAELPPDIESQSDYAIPASEIARLIAELAGDASERVGDSDRGPGHRLFVPPEWQDGDTTPQGGVAPLAAAATGQRESLDTIGGYHVYTREFDAETTGASLYREAQRRTLRAELDRHIGAQAVSPARLALRLLRLFGAPGRQGWTAGADEGRPDSRRLAQLVADPAHRHVFVEPRVQRRAETVVTFLIDNSGSMKRQRYEAIAVLIDTYCRALDLAGVSTEVLGFTTGAWSGGRARAAWERGGSPDDPAG